MGQSLSNILLHLVFSTKNRTPWLGNSWREELHSYIASIVKDCGAELIILNSVEDHIHIFQTLPRTLTMADLVKQIKASSSNWIHRTHPELAVFHWQDGYGAFSVSPGAHKGALISYIKNQTEHHKKVSFQEEFLRLLRKYEISYDERYV